MSANLLEGKEVAKQMRTVMKNEVEELSSQGIVPCLVVFQVGEDAASDSYLKMIKNAADKVGVKIITERLPADVSHQEMLKLIEEMNNDDSVHGMIVQLPLPHHIDEKEVAKTISPYKDVDCLNPVNVGHLSMGDERFIPCTPAGILKLLEHIEVDLTGKKAVVVGCSNIVGKPIGQLMLERNATVTYCHVRTKDLKKETKDADILVIAVGRPELINGRMIKEGAIVIDVGVNKVENRIVGDVEYDTAKDVAGYITPVPGGVGPMTITMLLNNTIEACKAWKNKQ